MRISVPRFNIEKQRFFRLKALNNIRLFEKVFKPEKKCKRHQLSKCLNEKMDRKNLANGNLNVFAF